MSLYEFIVWTFRIKIQISIQVATSCLDNSLLKYSAKEYFFRASLCHLSVDLLNAQHALEKYSQQYPAFQDSREYKLVKVSDFIKKNILEISGASFSLLGFVQFFFLFISQAFRKVHLEYICQIEYFFYRPDHHLKKNIGIR